MTSNRIVVGTRGSALARWQTEHVIGLIKQSRPNIEIELKVIKTQGDQDQHRPLADFGELGVFTKAIEDALLNGSIDLAVHSLKDLPTIVPPGLVIGAIPEREDPRDCLVSSHRWRLRDLPLGSRVGTSSARRTAQLLAVRPDLQILPLRGNVDTRLAKAQTDQYDAVVLAAAGIMRLGRADEITEYLDFADVLPDPGQGALAVEIRSQDNALFDLVQIIDHLPTRQSVTAERAFLRALGGGCRMPIGSHAAIVENRLSLSGTVISLDGSENIAGSVSGDPALADGLGETLAIDLLARGASTILDLYPLQGIRILVTRARGQAIEMSGKIKALGGDPVIFPLIDFLPVENTTELDAAIGSSHDWIVFTSANGVRAVAERITALGLDHNILRSAKVAAIGPGTARALEALGIKTAFIPSRFLGEQIAVELPISPGESALLLRADIASDGLAHGLNQRGVVVRDVDAYRTVLPPSPEIDLSRIDAITFSSSSTVRNFIEHLGDRRDSLSSIPVITIGPVTSATAKQMGMTVAAEAQIHTVEGMLSALAKLVQSRKSVQTII